jgi:glycosyltransferase involved in cell wall biosynthesis
MTTEPGDNNLQNDSPLTVIMPAYNEEEGIEQAVLEVSTEVLDRIPGSCLIAVNDGSKDKTGEILDRLAKADSRVRVLHKPNSGHGPSLVQGLNQATSEYIFLIDSDMQIPLSCFPQLWNTLQSDKLDGVFGIRESRQDPRFRLFLSVIISITLSTAFKVRLVDTNVPCKLFKRKIWTQLWALAPVEDLLAPSIAIAIYARRHGYKIGDVHVPHRARTKGEGSLKLKSLFRFCWKGYKQLMSLKEALS